MPKPNVLCRPWPLINGKKSAVAPMALLVRKARQQYYSDEQAFAFNWDDGYPDENCLRVNIWTPGLKDGRNAPSWCGCMVEVIPPAVVRSPLV